MYKTEITKVHTSDKRVQQPVTNTIHADYPDLTKGLDKTVISYQIVNNIMFVGLAITAAVIFYRALTSLML